MFEIAVISDFEQDENNSLENWTINYDTPITDDVIGYLEKNDVIKTLQEIQKLKPTLNKYLS